MRVLFVLFALILSSNTFADGLSLAEGKWGLDPDTATDEQLAQYNCQNNPMQVNISEDGKTYLSKHTGQPEVNAKILFNDNEFIAIQYEGEKRLMEDGRAHIWMMYFIDEDHFAWVRQDWIVEGEIKGMTPGRIRCDKEKIT